MKVSEQEYIKALSEYFHATFKDAHMITSKDLNPQVKTVLNFEGTYREVKTQTPAVRFTLFILISVLSSLLMATFLIWGTNEVFEIAIDYSLKNISIVGCIFLFVKITTRFDSQKIINKFF